ncbi:hypothetical protein IE53DRAFT_70373 [Violaceomyces palustris]|uniref:Uncharacterized protein n=1 Tax=Violaceomyces palustris TaxID=1673888 RepID=A0ACD0P8Y0_9BASI|nr:hypothetical protein IE53DRAFT_70373 [Violaceomyces palustris]
MSLFSPCGETPLFLFPLFALTGLAPVLPPGSPLFFYLTLPLSFSFFHFFIFFFHRKQTPLTVIESPPTVTVSAQPTNTIRLLTTQTLNPLSPPAHPALPYPPPLSATPLLPPTAFILPSPIEQTNQPTDRPTGRKTSRTSRPPLPPPHQPPEFFRIGPPSSPSPC